MTSGFCSKLLAEKKTIIMDLLKFSLGGVGRVQAFGQKLEHRRRELVYLYR
jgi:hypothetical protein